MSETDYLIGQAARIEAVITGIDGVAVDPQTVRLLTRAPDGTQTEIPADQIVKDATGAYHHDLTLNKAGRWYYRWQSGTPATSAAEGQLTVKPSRFQ